jgi:hypothetical protein
MNKTKGEMSRKLVYFCIRMLTVTAVWAMAITTLAVILDREVDLSDVLTFMAGAFGGELLMLLAKRVFAKPTKEDNEDGA